MKRLLIFLLITSCYRTLSSQQSCNFVQNNDKQRLHWNNKFPIKIHIDTSVPEIAYPAINRAIIEFNNNAIQSSQIFLPANDSYVTIYWRNTWDGAVPNEQATTTLSFVGSEIYKADIQIDAYNFTFNYDNTNDFSDVDLESLIVHELGHVLGLAHTSKLGSVMHPTLTNGEVRRQLGLVDINDLACEYK